MGWFPFRREGSRRLLVVLLVLFSLGDSLHNTFTLVFFLCRDCETLGVFSWLTSDRARQFVVEEGFRGLIICTTTTDPFFLRVGGTVARRSLYVLERIPLLWIAGQSRFSL
ncbi:unnamed protein product [Ectocarpus sp. 8 AP-2014]